MKFEREEKTNRQEFGFLTLFINNELDFYN